MHFHNEINKKKKGGNALLGLSGNRNAELMRSPLGKHWKFDFISEFAPEP